MSTMMDRLIEAQYLKKEEMAQILLDSEAHGEILFNDTDLKLVYFQDQFFILSKEPNKNTQSSLPAGI